VEDTYVYCDITDFSINALMITKAIKKCKLKKGGGALNASTACWSSSASIHSGDIIYHYWLSEYSFLIMHSFLKFLVSVESPL
jgi:hypothetical protein